MSTLSRFLGIPLAFAYMLERARVASVRLRWLVLVGVWLSSIYSVMLMVRDGFSSRQALVIVAALLLSLLLLWAHRRRYVLFLPSARQQASAAMAPAAEEKLSLRGSGLFEVNEQKRHLASVPVVFWTTRLGDHIVAAKVGGLNLLGVGIPADERGWWYAFIEPQQVLDLTDGTLHFGLSARPSLAVRYSTPKGAELLYLTCPDDETRCRLVRALQPRKQNEAAHFGAASS